MSRAPVRSEADVLAEALAAFRGGDVRVSSVKGLSDLSRGGHKTLAAAWPDLSESVRRRLTRQMGRLADDRVELNFGRALRVALEDPSPVVRQLAIAALWEDDADDIRERFSLMAGEDDSLDVRLAALRGLNRFAHRAAIGDLDDEAAESLRDQLIDFARADAEPADVRRLALEALGAYGGEDVFALIDEAYVSRDLEARVSAIVAMGRSMHGAWLSVLTQELAATDPESREAAARALGQIGDPGAVAALAGAGADPEPKVRTAAIAALGQIGGQAATKALRALESVASESERRAIADSMAEAQGGAFPL